MLIINLFSKSKFSVYHIQLTIESSPSPGRRSVCGARCGKGVFGKPASGMFLKNYEFDSCKYKVTWMCPRLSINTKIFHLGLEYKN